MKGSVLIIDEEICVYSKIIPMLSKLPICEKCLAVSAKNWPISFWPAGRSTAFALAAHIRFPRSALLNISSEKKCATSTFSDVAFILPALPSKTVEKSD